MRRKLLWLSFISLGALSSAAVAREAGEAPAGGGVSTNGENAEIVVTAQKRSERLQDVPLSINAATGDQLRSTGITNTDQLQKLVPGFTSERTAYGNAVYFIRGIGFNDTTLGVSPAVSIYIDQQPLPFTPMSRGAILDLERVEVLKGPQGTLFGQNSTGGAINYIAAKPTSDFRAGVSLGYGRFNEADIEAYVSGPLGNSLSARIAVRGETSQDWQKNYFNGERLGNKRFVNGRLSIQWQPSSDVNLLLTASGWKDNSDAQQPQLTLYVPQKTGAAARPLPFPIATFPTAPQNARAAAWDPGFTYRRHNWLYNFTGDLEVDLSDSIHLAALTSFVRYGQSVPIDSDGTPYPSFRTTNTGTIHTFSQEVRLSGDVGDVAKWMLGANYQRDKVSERLIVFPFATVGAHIFGHEFNSDFVDNDQTIKTKSVFGSADYKFTDQLTFQGSIRYTAQDRHHRGCNRDTGDGTLADAVGFLSTILTGTPQVIAPGACALLDINTGVPLAIADDNLNEDNLSFRGSLNWKPVRNALVYANITKGYKSGSFPTLPSTTTRQLQPVGQESVLAFEVGTKLNVIRNLTFDAAIFYYDYKDKQLSGYINDAVYGPLPTLVQIPKTHVEGAEASLVVTPIRGLNLSFNATYINSKVDQNPTVPIGPYGNPANFVGQSFPLTPKFQSTADVQYSFDLGSNLSAFVGASLTGRSATEAVLLSGDPSVATKEAFLHVPGYALLDLRAGLEAPDSRWRVEFWGRNVTNKVYNVGTTTLADFTLRYTGMPVTYGVSMRFRL